MRKNILCWFDSLALAALGAQTALESFIVEDSPFIKQPPKVAYVKHSTPQSYKPKQEYTRYDRQYSNSIFHSRLDCRVQHCNSEAGKWVSNY